MLCRVYFFVQDRGETRTQLGEAEHNRFCEAKQGRALRVSPSPPNKKDTLLGVFFVCTIIYSLFSIIYSLKETLFY